MIGFLSVPLICNASTIFTDNFDSYSNGPLSGQGNWSFFDSINHSSFTVQDVVTFQGSKALVSSGFLFGKSETRMRKKGTLLADGTITFYVRANNLGDGYVYLIESATGKKGATIQYGGPDDGVLNGIMTYWNGNKLVKLGDMAADTWYAVQIQWRSSDHMVRYNISGGAWTDFVPALTNWSAGLDTLELEANNNPGQVVYFDAVQENPTDPIIAKNPVLIVPGLSGTELKRGDELLWANIDKMFLDVDDGFLDSLQFNKNLFSENADIQVGSVINKLNALIGLGKFDYTDSLISDLKTQGYIENQTLFTFPYDWRYGVSGKYADGKTNVDFLAQNIQEILQQTGAQNVDVIAHSMGGLITKQYVKSHTTDNHIGKAVFVGVPSTGSPKAVKTLLEGDNLDMFFVSQDEIKKISENMPAIYDLLPTQQYYNIKGSFVKVVDQGSLLSPDYSENDLDYQEFEHFMVGDHLLNATAFNQAKVLHSQSFDNFDLRAAGVDMYAIDGCNTGTLGTITEEHATNILGQSIVQYKTPVFTAGDGTVPLESSTNLPVDQGKKYYALSSNHSKLMTMDGTRQQIVNIISGSNLPVNTAEVTQDASTCKLNGKAISVFSPVDILVTDQQGNTLGLADDKSVLNTIPGAAFEILGEHKFIYLPTDQGQAYAISMEGTGAGTYTVKTDDIINGQNGKTQLFSNLPVTTELTGTIVLGAEQDSLLVKQTPQSPVQTILPDRTMIDSTREFNNLTKPSYTQKEVKQNGAVPVKFQLLDALTKLPLQGPAATLLVNGKPAKSNGGANTDNVFKYDIVNKQYVYNLSTKLLVVGVNSLVINMPGIGTLSLTITVK